ncbi:MAG: hypothetical protein JW850_11370 [Thermoflexales bacterium]|nr:hypothetical protein [Thermoflexales bacterium]
MSSINLGNIMKAIRRYIPLVLRLPAFNIEPVMASWAKRIESYDAIPQVYQSSLKTLLGDSQTFLYMVLTPAREKFFHKTTEKLVCDLGDAIYVLERAGKRVSVRGYRWDSIRDVEVGTVLLYAWITIRGVTTEGESTASTFEFNSASSHYFTPILNKIRPAARGSDEASLAERAKFDYLTKLNYKFMNYARKSLVPGEKVIQTVWQPEIRLQVGPFSPSVTLAHLTILTDKELILIRDDERWGAYEDVRYGGIWQYIPLSSIVSASLADQPDALLTLSIHLSEHDRVERVFEISNKPQLERLQSEIEKRLSK